MLGFLAELQRRLKLPPASEEPKAAAGGNGSGLALVREEMPFELQALEIVLDVVRSTL